MSFTVNTQNIDMLSQVSIKVNFWASFHRSVHSGSNLGGYLFVSPVSLRRVGEFRRCMVRSRAELSREAWPDLHSAFLHPMLSSPSKNFFLWLILFNCCSIKSCLWALFSNRKFWIIGSLALQYKSQAFSSLWVNSLQLCLVLWVLWKASPSYLSNEPPAQREKSINIKL